ncbi:phosphotransacetylase [Patescibacteria group bacterium]|nr:phosphotransacetylase [Patescibacteria group bacterium]
MQNFIQTIKDLARKNPQRIVFPEGTEPRIVEAAKIIEKEGIAKPILITDPPVSLPDFDRYAEEFASIREISPEEAHKTMKNPYYYATMMTYFCDADGMIAGPTLPGRDRILPAFKIIKTKEKFHRASGFFFMVLPDREILLFADCAVNIEPTAEELAEIAIDTAETARRFNLEPRIAMLSFSTAGSTDHPLVEKVKKAAHLVKLKRPDLKIEDMEMQADAALEEKVADIKAPGSIIGGHANVLIFPDLEAGNIGYKLVEQLAGAKAIGPIIQGLKKPVNELSRGCSVEDIVNLAAITTIESQEMDYVCPVK